MGQDEPDRVDSRAARPPVDPADAARARGSRAHALLEVGGAALRLGLFCLPAIVLFATAPLAPLAADDAGVVRALGGGSTGALRGLDVAWGAALAALPIGTRALAITAGGALLVALGAAAVAALSDRVGDGRRSVLGAAMGASCMLSAPFAVEASGVGGTALAALLALAPLVLTARRGGVRADDLPAMALCLVLAATSEPTAALASVAAIAAWAWLGGGLDRAAVRAVGPRALAAAALGLFPVGVAIARARGAPEASVLFEWIDAPLGERGASGRIAPLAFARAEWGWVVAGFAIAGVALALRRREARPIASALFVLVVAGGVATAAGAPEGPTRFGAPALLATAAAFALAGHGAREGITWVQNAPIPFARASATMMVFLLLALPARFLDDATSRVPDKRKGAADQWAEAAAGALPAGAVVLVPTRKVELRLLAARSSGTLRGDVELAPLFAPRSRGAARLLQRDPKLAPVFRDVILGGAPEELSLSELATLRPLVYFYEPTHPRTLARHVRPTGLFGRFEPEPGGRAERRAGVEDLLPTRDALVKALLTGGKDPELLEATAHLLRWRAIALAAADDREVLSRSLDDLRRFAPDDPMSSTLVRRIVTQKAGIDVRDLVP